MSKFLGFKVTGIEYLLFKMAYGIAQDRAFNGRTLRSELVMEFNPVCNLAAFEGR